MNNPDIKVDGNTITIDTSLKVGLERFKSNPNQRGGILSSLAGSIAGATGRKSMDVRVSNSERDVEITMESINISEDRIKRALKWEDDGAEKGAAAIFGDVARALAKRSGTAEYGAIKREIESAPSIVNQGRLGQMIASSVASFASAAPGVEKITQEFPGMSGAIMASFIMPADCLNPAPLFKAENQGDRWRAIWTTMVAEALSPESVSEGAYPDEETREKIQRAAEILKSISDNVTGKVDPQAAADLVNELQEMFEGAELGAAGDEQDASLDSDDEAAAAPVKIGGGTGNDMGKDIKIMSLPEFLPIRESELTSAMREFLIDVRLENTAGQQTGRVGSQLHRIISDKRVFSKRVRVVEPPDACVVVAIDYSGSMGSFESGTRLRNAIELHDAIVYALNELDIPVASCAYCGNEPIESHIHPLNLPRTQPLGRSAMALNRKSRLGGNGDVGAMLWSTKQIAESGCSKGAVIFLADGQIGPESAGEFRARAKELNTSVFHVDYINAASSPFGGVHIHAAGVGIKDIAHPLAKGLSVALGLD